METIHEIVRRAEDNYITGTAKLSKYVTHSMSDTLDRIDAYLNSMHINGDTDSLGREKPFFDIGTAASNVWFRATDIDRKNIKVRATKSGDTLKALLASIFIQKWMKKARFGTFLNEWGLTLARYGSAVVKIVENEDGLHISVVPWSRLIVDQIDFDAAPKIEVIELSQEQLYRRIETHGYDKAMVKELLEAERTRQNKDKSNKDNVSDFIKLYEIHGVLPKILLTKKERDEDIFVQQMHVVSFQVQKQGRSKEYTDYTLYSGQEEKDPYRLTHLIPQEGRTLAIGAIEHLFEAQWMQNHSVKAIKDQLDLAGKIIFQTADPKFMGRNVISDIETGDIFIHSMNMPLTQVNNQSHDTVQWQNFQSQWKVLGNEINGISEAMLGTSAKSGTAWRQTEALLQESHSLFEIMTENKGLAIEDMFREDIIPYIKKHMLNNTDEISHELDARDIEKVDKQYVKYQATEQHNEAVIEDILRGNQPTSTLDMQTQSLQQTLNDQGATRYFVPSNTDKKKWKEVLKDLEWDLEIDITGESQNTAENMATLNTALQVIANPQFAQNKAAQAVVGRILELTGTMSAIELASVIGSTPTTPPQAQDGSMQTPVTLPTQQIQNGTNTA